MVRKLLMSTVVLFGATGIASAADLPTTKGAPIYTPPRRRFSPGPVSTSVRRPAISSAIRRPRPAVGLPGYNPSGVDGGAHIGYNYQIGQFVAGLEGDVNGSSYNGSSTFGALAYNTTERVDGSVRGRLGVAWDRALIYATGGAAFGNFRNQYAIGPALDTCGTRGSVGRSAAVSNMRSTTTGRSVPNTATRIIRASPNSRPIRSARMSTSMKPTIACKWASATSST